LLLHSFFCFLDLLSIFKMSWEEDEFVVPPVVQSASKWELEDKEEEVKESWEDESSEKPKNSVQKESKPESTTNKGNAKKGKTTTKPSKNIEETLDDPLMEKQRKQLMVEEADFENTASMFSGLSNELKIDIVNPKDARDFDALADSFSKKLNLYSTSTHYTNFLKNLFRQLTANLESNDISQIATSLSVLANEKIKSEKEKKKKKTVTKRAAVNLKNEDVEEGDYDEFSDFL